MDKEQGIQEIDSFLNDIKENNKYRWFVEHVQAHLDEGQEVICTICKKTVDEVAMERIREMANRVSIHFNGKKVTK